MDNMKLRPETYQIELDSVVKSYKDVVAVNRSSLKIKSGEFFSLLGPSGCGKTTTLKIIGGFEEPDQGRVFLEGEDVTGSPANLRSVHTVFQDYAIFPHMNIYENIYFPLKMHGVSKKEAEPRIREMLKLVNLEGFEKRYSSQLSGGQEQRVAIARALINQPKALLLDEPLGALDFKLRLSMQKALKNIQRKLNITFVYVTHDQTEAITMSDQIMIMEGGICHQVGTPDEVYNYPQTAFVASFVGEMNFLDAAVISTLDSGVVECKLGDSNVSSLSRQARYSVGETVLLAIRPEKVDNLLWL